jgi:hypothetical protein
VVDVSREFYGERSNCNDAACSVFVHEALLLQLGQYTNSVFGPTAGSWLCSPRSAVENTGQIYFLG